MSTDAHRCPSCFNAPGPGGVADCPSCGWQPGTDNEPPFLPLGTLLDGRYRLGCVLGHGGFGITYLAWDENLTLALAVKEYLPRDCATRGPDRATISVYSSRGEEFDYGLARVIDEARALARFDQHPGVVGVKNFFRAHGTGYIVMDYVPGITLKQFLDRKGGRIPFDLALRLLMPIMDALRAVHAAGLLHRDIAPDNIRITPKGQVKLLDFGAARQVAGEHSRSLSVMLKPGYAPPEQYRSRGKQGPWTDVYALAATLCRCITGQSPPEALDRMEEDELVPPSALGVGIPAAAEAALMRGLALKVVERTGDLRTLQRELLNKEHLRGQQASTARYDLDGKPQAPPKTIVPPQVQISSSAPTPPRLAGVPPEGLDGMQCLLEELRRPNPWRYLGLVLVVLAALFAVLGLIVEVFLWR